MAKAIGGSSPPTTARKCFPPIMVRANIGWEANLRIIVNSDVVARNNHDKLKVKHELRKNLQRLGCQGS